ncbi:hypothetical protein [uncultured Corynebacterium sp.]|uniref:hypothetical protein n=1 Tax=uncultured Corynebacterium sp. TaxID=159447 RepID=UPI0025EAF01C|nr:hypothetical protein [uncultured Corynebacterium sp.]
MARGGRFATVLVSVGAVVTALLLSAGFGYPGVITGVTLVVVTAFAVFRRDSDRELRALRHSIEHSASDISRTLDQWHEFHHSAAPEHVRDRTRHRPRLLNPDCGVDSVRRFHDAARSAETFLRGLPSKVHTTTTVAALTALLNDTDRRAACLDSLWSQARRESGTPDLS